MEERLDRNVDNGVRERSVKNYFDSIFSQGIGRTLFSRFFLLSVIPMCFLGWISIQSGVDTIKADQINTLSSVAYAKHAHLKGHFSVLETNLSLIAESKNTAKFIESLIEAYQASNRPLKKFTGGYQWSVIEDEYGSDIHQFLTTYSHIDVLLLDSKGNVIYSIRRDSDLGANFFAGDLSSTKIAQAVRSTLESGESVYSDSEFYAPYENKIASFLVRAVVDEYGDKIGAIAVHLASEAITHVVESYEGGDTGEIYLVGVDQLMRSQSRFDDKSSVLVTKVDTELTNDWLNALEAEAEAEAEIGLGEKIYDDYRGVSVLGVSLPVEFGGVPMLMVAGIDESEAFLPITRLTERIIVVVVVTVGLVLLLSIFSVRAITLPILDLTVWAEKLSAGQLVKMNIETPNNELGVLNQTFIRFVDSIQDVSNMLSYLSVGDLSKVVVPRSDEDELAVTINNLQRAMKDVVSQASSIAQGDYDAQIRIRSENDALGVALRRMTVSLKEARTDSDRQNKMNEWKSSLAVVLRGDKNIEDLANLLSIFFAKRSGARVVAFYIVKPGDDDEILSWIGGYAAEKTKLEKQTIQLGEGLAGQAALQNEMILVDDLPVGFLDVSSSSGSIDSNAVLIVPLAVNGRVVGVVELGTTSVFSDDIKKSMEISAEPIAIALETYFGHQKTKALLSKTQQQSHVLKNQQDALETVNEDLKKQAEQLRASEEELKQQSEELRVSNEELEEKQESLSKQNAVVLDAKRDLQVQADELALASKYKSEFLANMSHELRTPLNSMLILSKSLSENREKTLTIEQAQDAEIIHDGGKGLLALINDIMDLSKVEAGMLDIHHEPVDIARTVTNMDVMFGRLASDKGLGFDLNVSESIPKKMYSDSKRIEQVLKNFLSNAFKFTEDGGVKLGAGKPTEGVEFRDGTLTVENTVAFSVIDSGIGIPREKQQAIFEAFQQVDGSTSRKYGGTGLGLSISREIAKLLGGEIQIESDPGQGSTFTLYLPIGEESDFGGPDSMDVGDESGGFSSLSTEPMPNVSRAGSLPVWISDDRNGCLPSDNSILIIEDDKHFVNILVRLARQRNFKVLASNLGRDGLLLAEQYQPSGVLLDLGLPDIHGYEVLEQLKYHVKTRHIPVHIISGGEGGDSKNLGAMSFLQKPINESSIDTVFDTIRNDLSGSQKTILVVEDDLSNQRAISRLLENEGVDITFAETLAAAENQLDSHRFSCIILDLGLPDKGGLDAVIEISEKEHANGTPIVVYTGREMTDKEFTQISERTSSVIVKGKASLDRLVDDVSLFLHKMDNEKDGGNSQEVAMLHDEDEMLRGRQILLVDDDMRNVFALKRQLEREGIEVTAAENGQVALDCIEEQDEPFDLILMDIMMPIMDGYEAMEKIRLITAYKQRPIIALTANAMPEDRAKCIDAGASEYLTKPVDVDKLFSMLRVWMFDSKR
ncbi:hypothetical protein A9Q99_27680 [Gammaproteobacteria bacterium 45_16_T64]|nr:hypothetical protein A9Q99_27680 [Gammaproteobacteria bacterium 45_16_T64]